MYEFLEDILNVIDFFYCKEDTSLGPYQTSMIEFFTKIIDVLLGVKHTFILR